MELFKLFGTIAMRNSEANKGIDDTTDKAKRAKDDIEELGDEGTRTEGKLGSAFSKIGSAAAKVGQTIGVGMLTASAAVVKIGKDAIETYSEYEQLVGGVETLFGAGGKSLEEYADSVGKSVEEVEEKYNELIGAQEIVLENSANAYKTAGLSANDYMETVTSISASLIQSLNGDTTKAAEVADMAITDMSDNANKMGTSIDSIQNAYQGFAKQNYTMLDNLKLGYGGTKEEMERLLSDAEKISGIKYDVSSYSDIVDAIHVVQTEMGITGTTAKEASATIQGSIQSAKSAWQNLITGLADDNANLDELVNNFFNSIVTVGENIIPRISVILNGITGLIQKLAPKIIEALPGVLNTLLPEIVKGAQALLQAFVSVLPQLVKLIMNLMPDIIKAFQSIFKAIVDALPQLIDAIVSALPTLIPQIVSAVVAMAVYLMKNIDRIIQPIINKLPEIIISVVDALITNLPILIDGVISLVLGLVKAIPKIILGIIEALPTIIEKIITGLIECIPQLIEGLIMLVIELVAHLPEIILGLIEAIPKIIVAVAKALVEAGPKIFEAFGRIFGGAWEKITEIFSGIVDWFKDIFEKLKMWAVSVYTKIIAWFKSIFEGLRNWALGIYTKITGFFQNIWNSITGVFSKVGEFFSNVFRQAVDGVKGAFNGIKQWFSNLWQNIWNGIKTPINWIIDGINAVIDGLNSLKVDIPDWVPFVGGQTWGVNIPKIAKLAKGGFVEGGTPFIAGEAGAEAVIPLENNNQWIYKFAHAFADGLSTFYDGNNFTQTPNKGAGGKIVNINLYLDNVHVKNDDDIEDVANKVSERIAEKLVMEGMAVG